MPNSHPFIIPFLKSPRAPDSPQPTGDQGFTAGGSDDTQLSQIQSCPSVVTMMTGFVRNREENKKELKIPLQSVFYFFLIINFFQGQCPTRI